MHHLTRITLLLLAALTAGCAQNSSGPLSLPPPEERTAQLAAYAAGADPPRPDSATSQDLHVTAVINHAARTLTLQNFSDRPLKDFEVWIAGTYVRHIANLPPRAGLTIHLAQFFSAKGSTLASHPPASIHRVQLKLNGTFYDPIGPAHD